MQEISSLFSGCDVTHKPGPTVSTVQWHWRCVTNSLSLATTNHYRNHSNITTVNKLFHCHDYFWLNHGDLDKCDCLIQSQGIDGCMYHICINTHNLHVYHKSVLIHLAVCLTTGPKALPNRALHIVRSRASSFKCEYPLLSLRSSSSFLRFLPRLPVTSIPPFIFPSITRCRRQFLHKMWPIQLAFRFLISCKSVLPTGKYLNPWELFKWTFCFNTQQNVPPLCRLYAVEW